MGGGPDERRQDLGDVGIKSVDNHLRNGATGSRRGIALNSSWVLCPALLRLRTVDQWNALPHSALAGQQMAQQPRRPFAAPGSVERIACNERSVEHSVAVDQRPQPTFTPNPCRRSSLPGRAHPRMRPSNGRITLLAGMALRPCCQPVKLLETPQ